MQSNAPFFTCAGYGFLNNGKATSCIEELAMQKTTYITQNQQYGWTFSQCKGNFMYRRISQAHILLHHLKPTIRAAEGKLISA
jgi:hypothetical protein